MIKKRLEMFLPSEIPSMLDVEGDGARCILSNIRIMEKTKEYPQNPGTHFIAYTNKFDCPNVMQLSILRDMCSPMHVVIISNNNTKSIWLELGTFKPFTEI